MKTFDEIMSKFVVMGKDDKPFNDEETKQLLDWIQNNLKKYREKYQGFEKEALTNEKFIALSANQIHALLGCFSFVAVDLEKFCEAFKSMAILYLVCGLEMNSLEFEDEEKKKEEPKL